MCAIQCRVLPALGNEFVDGLKHARPFACLEMTNECFIRRLPGRQKAELGGGFFLLNFYCV